MKIVIPAGGIFKNGGSRQIADIANALSDQGHLVEVLIQQGSPIHFPIKGRIRYVPHLGKDYIPYGDVILVNYYTTFQGAYDAWPEKCVRFCQAFEPDFVADRQVAIQTYQTPIPTICISTYLAKKVEALSGIPARVAQSGISREIFHPKKSSVKDSPKTIMYIARDPKAGYHLKRYIDFVKAIRLFHKWYEKPYRVHLVCTERRLPLSGIPHQVYQPKSSKEMADLYRKSDIFVATSTTEGFSLPVLEAMACQTPAVTTNAGGNMDFCKHRINSWVTPPKKPEALAKALLRVLQDKVLYQKLKRNGYLSTKHLTKERFHQQVITHLEAIVAARR